MPDSASRFYADPYKPESTRARQLPADWESVYGYRPLLLETLVDAEFRGTSYQAANWTYLGETRGRGRMDQHHERL